MNLIGGGWRTLPLNLEGDVDGEIFATVGICHLRRAVHLYIEPDGGAGNDLDALNEDGVITIGFEQEVVGSGSQHAMVVADVGIGIDWVGAADDGDGGEQGGAGNGVGDEAAYADEASFHVVEHGVAILAPVRGDL